MFTTIILVLFCSAGSHFLRGHSVCDIFVLNNSRDANVYVFGDDIDIVNNKKKMQYHAFEGTSMYIGPLVRLQLRHKNYSKLSYSSISKHTTVSYILQTKRHSGRETTSS